MRLTWNADVFEVQGEPALFSHFIGKEIIRDVIIKAA
jgi:hypothetical protein